MPGPKRVAPKSINRRPPRYPGPGWKRPDRGHCDAARWTPDAPSAEELRERGGFVYAWVQVIGFDTPVLCQVRLVGTQPRERVEVHNFSSTMLLDPEDYEGMSWPVMPDEHLQ